MILSIGKVRNFEKSFFVQGICIEIEFEKNFYEYFFLLVVSIRKLCSNEISNENNSLALTLLQQFVENYTSHYGP